MPDLVRVLAGLINDGPTGPELLATYLLENLPGLDDVVANHAVRAGKIPDPKAGTGG